MEAQEVGISHLRTELARPIPKSATAPSTTTTAAAAAGGGADGSPAEEGELQRDAGNEAVVVEEDDSSDDDDDDETSHDDEDEEEDDQESEDDDEEEEEEEAKATEQGVAAAPGVQQEEDEQQQQQQPHVEERSSSTTSLPPVPPNKSTSTFSWAQAVKSTPVRPSAPKSRVQSKEPAIPVVEESMADLKISSMPSAAPSTQNGDVTSRLIGTGGNAGGATMTAEEDDDEGWISVTNIKEARAKGEGLFGSKAACRGAPVSEMEENMVVACVTTDFGMQNVLLQVRKDRGVVVSSKDDG